MERATRPRARTSRTVVPARAQSYELLARSLTHELRQSLSLISGYAELLASGSVSEAERSNLIQEIRLAARRLGASLEILEQSDVLSLLSFGSGPEHQVLDLRGKP